MLFPTCSLEEIHTSPENGFRRKIKVMPDEKSHDY